MSRRSPIFHYPNPDDKYPDPKLGEENWKVVSEERPEDGDARGGVRDRARRTRTS